MRFLPGQLAFKAQQAFGLDTGDESGVLVVGSIGQGQGHHDTTVDANDRPLVGGRPHDGSGLGSKAKVPAEPITA